MRTLLFLLSITFVFTSYGQDFHVEGSARINNMAKDNETDSVVVRLNDGTLAVRDVSSLSAFRPNLSIVGFIEVDGADESVYVSGNHAYLVGDGGHDFKVIQVSNPERPLNSGSAATIDFEGLHTDVKVAGQYAYIVDHEQGKMRIIDVSNPRSPQSVSEITINQPNAIYVSGSYAYIAADTNTYIIDISDPSQPSIVSSEFFSSDQTDIYVHGKIAYLVSAVESRLSFIDISDPVNPIEVLSRSNVGSANSLHFSGLNLYGSSEDKLFKYDFNSSGSVAVNDNPQDIYISGQYLYHVGHDLVVRDVNNLGKELARIDLGMFANKIHVSGKYAYVVGSGYMQIIDISGVEISSLSAGSIDVTNDITTHGQLHVTGGVNVGAGGIYTDGDLGVAGSATITHVATGSADAGFKIQNEETVFGKKWWRFYVQHGDGDMLLYNSESNSNNGIAGEFKASTGTYNALSDRRLKKNFEKMDKLLPSISKLNVYKYHMTSEHSSDVKHYGLIAQDVEQYFPELVHYDTDSDVYRLEYSTLGVLAIQAIKEQQEIIKKQDKEIKEIRKILEQLIANHKSH